MNARLVSVPAESQLSAKKDALLATLRELLRTSFELRRTGGAHARFAHAQGYADGYMRVLVDANVVSERELLDFVRDVRRGVDGPEVTALVSDESIFAA